MLRTKFNVVTVRLYNHVSAVSCSQLIQRSSKFFGYDDKIVIDSEDGHVTDADSQSGDDSVHSSGYSEDSDASSDSMD